MSRRVRAVADQEPLPLVPDREAQGLAGPAHLFSAARYEGSDADERRVFYVAMTRARDTGTPTIRPGNRHGRMRDGLVAHCPDRRDEVGE